MPTNSVELPPESPAPQPATEKHESLSRSPEPSDFALAKAEEDDADRTADGDDQILAADYDPSLDRREDEQKRIGGAGPSKGEPQPQPQEEEEVEEVEEEDLDDMFAVAMGEKKLKKVKKVVVSSLRLAQPSLSSFFSSRRRRRWYPP
jgi:serine/threonine-protein kinase PRP4